MNKNESSDKKKKVRAVKNETGNKNKAKDKSYKSNRQKLKSTKPKSYGIVRRACKK